ncbi:FAD-dependent oxidoreductase [uncultured Ruthenibacterium sp.]|uniref:FAD-dependent oxidoreductase n=1 Tax=uncultured Ruthenibacterium sp. TaxID=1905347 RepID=UPI00349E7B71
MEIIVVGGGWAGCAAAYQAAKSGAHVSLFERTDMLLGTGLAGGIFRNNGRFTAAEEMLAMGGGELFRLMDQNTRHKNVCFPGHQHASLYDIAKMPTSVFELLRSAGVEIHLQSRIVSAILSGSRLLAVKTPAGQRYAADAFIDTTGTAGPTVNCTKYGSGCAMCVLRCPSFGGRLSLTALAGVPEYRAHRGENAGAFSGSCKLMKESLSLELQQELNENGVAIVPIPLHLREDHLSQKACQQYAHAAYAENIVLLDTGHAKMMTPFFPMEKLHQIPGFSCARYEDPYAGGKGNSVRFMAMAPRDDALRVRGMENLLCAGEKAGPLVGHTEAIVTGVLAGYNATRLCKGENLLTLPRSLATGEAITWVNQQTFRPGGADKKYTFSGSVLMEHLEQRRLLTMDIDAITSRTERAGMRNIFA